MNKKQRRKQKGEIVGYHPAKIIQGKRIGAITMKTIRKNVLKDVIRLKNQGKPNKEIHDFLCEKYGFRDDNPIEKRYLGYIKEHNL